MKNIPTCIVLENQPDGRSQDCQTMPIHGHRTHDLRQLCPCLSLDIEAPQVAQLCVCMCVYDVCMRVCHVCVSGLPIVYTQRHYHPKLLSPKVTVVKSHYHPKPLSSKVTIIQSHYHPKSLSSKVTIIQSNLRAPPTPFPPNMKMAPPDSEAAMQCFIRPEGQLDAEVAGP